jgi:hypothetical protein
MTHAPKPIPYWYRKVLLPCNQSIIDADNYSYPAPLIINIATFRSHDGEPYRLLSEERIQSRNNRQQILVFCKFGGSLNHWTPPTVECVRGVGGGLVFATAINLFWLEGSRCHVLRCGVTGNKQCEVFMGRLLACSCCGYDNRFCVRFCSRIAHHPQNVGGRPFVGQAILSTVVQGSQLGQDRLL